MGDAQARFLDSLVAEDEQVEVERPWALRRHPLAHAAEAALELQQPVEQLAGREGRLDRRRTVQEEWLVDDRTDRVGLPKARDRDDVDVRVGRERCDRRTHRPLAVAEVGAEPDVGQGHGRETTTPTVPSSPAGRTSGFVTRTRTRSGRNLRSSSSATAPASASSSWKERASDTSCTVPATSM